MWSPYRHAAALLWDAVVLRQRLCLFRKVLAHRKRRHDLPLVRRWRPCWNIAALLVRGRWRLRRVHNDDRGKQGRNKHDRGQGSALRPERPCLLGLRAAASVLLLACFRFRSKHLQKQWRLHISVHSRLHYVGTQKLAVPEAVAQGEYHFFLSHVCAAAFRPRVVRDVPTYGHTRACGDGAQAWTTGANQMRICKERLKVLCPDVVVFLECDGRDSRSVSRSVKASRPVWPPQRLAALSPPPSKLELALRSVDDLRMGMGAEYVERSRAFIFFVSSGYFDSCSRLAVARTLDSQAGAVDRCWTGAMIAHSRRQTAFASF
jgi:hypothetical protein